MARTWPVIEAASGEARKTTAAATSSGVTKRPLGIRASMRARACGSLSISARDGVSTVAGAIALARTLCGSPFDREHPRHLDEARLGDAVDRTSGDAGHAMGRGDGDDAAAAARDGMPAELLGEKERAGEVD